MGRNNFTMNEISSGVGRLGADVNRQILVQGDAERPVVTGDLNLSVQPSEPPDDRQQYVVQQSADQRTFHLHGDPQRQRFGHDDQLPVSGYALGDQFDGRELSREGLDRLLRGISTIRTGWCAPSRASNSPAFANSSDEAEYENTNSLHSGTAGVRMRPVKNLTANLEGEIGRANNPLTPVSDRNYHALNGLISYRT